MLFDHCAECQLCCRIDEGFPPLEITLNNAEQQNLGRLCITTTCEHLGAQGCTLGDDKPFGCQLYPLSYNPKTKDFFVRRVLSVDAGLPPATERSHQ